MSASGSHANPLICFHVWAPSIAPGIYYVLRPWMLQCPRQVRSVLSWHINSKRKGKHKTGKQMHKDNFWGLYALWKKYTRVMGEEEGWASGGGSSEEVAFIMMRLRARMTRKFLAFWLRFSWTSLGEMICWEGEDGEGFRVNGKILKQLLSGRNRKGWEKRKEKGHQGPSWLCDCVRGPVDAKHRHTSQVLHKDEALCPCSSPDTLLGMRWVCRSVYLILIKFDGLWGFSLLSLTRRIPTATPS